MNIYDVIVKPVVTEKGVTAKEASSTLCFQVAPDATKTQIRSAVEKLFKVKVDEVRTQITVGKLRRRGRFAGFRPNTKKAWVRLKDGKKVPEYAEV